MAFYGSGEDRRVPDDRLAPLLIPLTGVMVVLLVVFFVLFHYTTVAGPSMRPTLLAEDRLLLTKAYATPHRGDIVVFDWKRPDGQTEEVVKRVVGVPGDTIVMRGDVCYVNGAREPADRTLVIAAHDVPFGPVTVPAGKVFVLGDNRPVSLDSRFIGFIPLRRVLGRAVAIFSPVTRLRLIPGGGG